MIIAELIERFDYYQDTYKSQQYNEAQVRQEFIDPFFKALGWDLDNAQGFAEAYKEVIHEDAIKVGHTTRSPDYSFRLGGIRKFFVETKKPSVNLADDPAPALQLRTYAWNAKLPLSILTDFEEFVVYDCRFQPQKTDEPQKARLLYLKYTEYLDHWDEIANIFSKEAILKGSFNNYVEATKSRRGAKEVDVAFLEEISSWRESLARNIAIRNPDLSVQDLNTAVQNTIDRIIFLRICEDRGIEKYEQLKAIADEEGIYARLCDLFHHADGRYNSGLFHFNDEPDRAMPDLFTLGIKIDDNPLQKIISSIYPPGPYNFAIMPPEILGQVYEQFLGKVIRLTEGHHAKVEDKPEVRKAGGVFYTPSYIVEYIVKNTVGKLLEGKTPRQVSFMRILDPACGSGSFLIGAYQYLLDWHLDWYSRSLRPFIEAGEPETSPIIKKLLPSDKGTEVPDKERRKGRKKRQRKVSCLPIYQGSGNIWRLTTEERKRILLNSIYGVDIDPQAVEVTKLSLLLKVLEGENRETIQTLLRFSEERALPDLDNNIKCGNSLIGFDFIEKFTDLESDITKRVNPFDWMQEFPGFFQTGGFDAVIGNPPYIRIHKLVDFYPQEVRYIQETFSSAAFGKVDIYLPFVEKGHALLKTSGILGFIVPNKFMQADYGVGLRNLIVTHKALKEIVDFGYAQVFENATIYTCLLFLSGQPEDNFVASFNTRNKDPKEFLLSKYYENHSVNEISKHAWSLTNSSEKSILEKVENKGEMLPQFVDIMITGVKTGANSIYSFELIGNENGLYLLRPEDTDDSVELESTIIRPYWKSESMKRYHQIPSNRLLLYPYELSSNKTSLIPNAKIKSSCPKIWDYLNSHKNILEGRQKGKLKGPSWYGLSFASDLRMFSANKIITPTLAPTNSFSIDVEGHLFPQGAGGGCGIVLKPDQPIYYFLGLLNSRLLTFYFQHISSCFQGGWFAYEPRYLRRIPIRIIDPTNVTDVIYRDRITSLAKQMIDMHKHLAEARTSHEQTLLQRQISAADKQIDRLVYELYELTEEEIVIVEGI